MPLMDSVVSHRTPKKPRPISATVVAHSGAFSADALLAADKARPDCRQHPGVKLEAKTHRDDQRLQQVLEIYCPKGHTIFRTGFTDEVLNDISDIRAYNSRNLNMP